jgi:hypothetical protein
MSCFSVICPVVAGRTEPYLVAQSAETADERPKWITIINLDSKITLVENGFQVWLRIDLKYHSTALKVRATSRAYGEGSR